MYTVCVWGVFGVYWVCAGCVCGVYTGCVRGVCGVYTGCVRGVCGPRVGKRPRRTRSHEGVTSAPSVGREDVEKVTEETLLGEIGGGRVHFATTGVGCKGVRVKGTGQNQKQRYCS